MSTTGTVLVTGATGFTGGHLARALKRRGNRVRALVRPSSKHIDALAGDGIEPVEGQLMCAEDVQRAVKGAATIYHIAAAYREARHSDRYYFQVNVDGTRHVLDAACREGTERVVHCSTVGVHGKVKNIPANEIAPMNPGDSYQQSKLEGERVAQQAFANGMPGAIFRPTGIYGPGDMRFLKLFSTIHSGRFCMFGSGQVLYHLTFIDDLVDGIICCGEHANARGQVYILAGPRYTSLNELVALMATALDRPAPSGHLPLWPLLGTARICEWICRPMGIEPPLYRRRCDFFCKDRAFSSEKAMREIGYQPKVDLAEGLKRTADWYHQNGLLKP